MPNKGFEGWYFKHQKGRDMIAFIPGRAESGAFVQVITQNGSRQFYVPNLSVSNKIIRAGGCTFSRRGCYVDLPGISGRIMYGKLTPLKSDIMGPFRFFEMECRHSVISMAHSIRGCLLIDGERHNYDGGVGYIEADSGTSFPQSYLWLQCGNFSRQCSVMLSTARVPFCGVNFIGCICAIVYRGREYRLATYNGVHIRVLSDRHVCLTQGRFLLEIDIDRTDSGHKLSSPVRGAMSGTIRESINTAAHVRFWESGKLVFDMTSEHATFEYVP